MEIVPPLVETIQVINKTDCRPGDCTNVSLTNQGHSLEDSDSADELLKHIKSFCCQGHNIIVERQRFLTITQHAGEKFAKYLARLKGQAEFADFTLECGKDS